MGLGVERDKGVERGHTNGARRFEVADAGILHTLGRDHADRDGAQTLIVVTAESRRELLHRGPGFSNFRWVGTAAARSQVREEGQPRDEGAEALLWPCRQASMSQVLST